MNLNYVGIELDCFLNEILMNQWEESQYQEAEQYLHSFPFPVYLNLPYIIRNKESQLLNKIAEYSRHYPLEVF